MQGRLTFHPPPVLNIKQDFQPQPGQLVYAVAGATPGLGLTPAQWGAEMVQTALTQPHTATLALTTAFPPGCQLFNVTAAPRGPWVAVDLACQAGHASTVQVVDTASGELKSLSADLGSHSIFLNWTPDGREALLLTDMLGEAKVYRVGAADGVATPVMLPGDTYDAAFSPDGTRLIYATTRGLGFGSALWSANADGSWPVLLVREPRHIVAYARFSPLGDKLAYIRMADSNIPFTVGELWVMDAAGGNARAISAADAGHGYPPAWSPDGRQIAFVYRENGDNVVADQIAGKLASNIYVADLHTYQTYAVTAFENTLAEAPVWSPDGAALAFAAQPHGGLPSIWVAAPEANTERLYPLTANTPAALPVWVAP